MDVNELNILPDNPDQIAEYVYIGLEDNPELKEIIYPILKNKSTSVEPARLTVVCIALYKRIIELEKIVKNKVIL